jgi:Na+/alanine symporter
VQPPLWIKVICLLFLIMGLLEPLRAYAGFDYSIGSIIMLACGIFIFYASIILAWYLYHRHRWAYLASFPVCLICLLYSSDLPTCQPLVRVNLTTGEFFAAVLLLIDLALPSVRAWYRRRDVI